MLGRKKAGDAAFEQIDDVPPQGVSDEANSVRPSSFRLRNLVGSAFESAAGAMPSWLSTPRSAEADEQEHPSPPGSNPATHAPQSNGHASGPARRRVKSYDELLDHDSDDNASNSDLDSSQQRPSRGKPPTDPKSQSSRRQCGSQDSLPRADGEQAPPTATPPDRRKTSSPIRSFLARFSDSQRMINFDDATLSALDGCSARQSGSEAHSQPAEDGHDDQPPSAMQRASTTSRIPWPRPADQSEAAAAPALIRARAASMEPAGAAAIAVASEGIPSGGAAGWLPTRSMLKASPLYNRLPSDDWQAQLLADDSAMEVAGARPVELSTPSRTPLQDGLSKLSSLAAGAKARAAAPLPSAQAPVQVAPALQAAPTYTTPQPLPSRDSTHSTSSFRSEPWEASSARGSSATSLRRMDPGPAGGAVPDEMLDIFEPPDQDAATSPPPVEASSAWQTQDIELVKAMTGQQALDALEEGALVRKKWVTHLGPAEAKHAARTRRHLKCQLQGSAVVLQYMHQGVRGLLDNTEVTATVQRVEALGGSWAPDADIRIHSSLGVLSIQPPSPAAFTLWTLGLNAALAVSHSRCKAYILSRPLHTIPRDVMFLVHDTNDAPHLHP